MVCPQYPGSLITNLAAQLLKSPLYLAALPKSSPNSVAGFARQVQEGLFSLSTREMGSQTWFQWQFHFNHIWKCLTTSCPFIKSREPILAKRELPGQLARRRIGCLAKKGMCLHLPVYMDPSLGWSHRIMKLGDWGLFTACVWSQMDSTIQLHLLPPSSFFLYTGHT